MKHILISHADSSNKHPLALFTNRLTLSNHQSSFGDFALSSLTVSVPVSATPSVLLTLSASALPVPSVTLFALSDLALNSPTPASVTLPVFVDS